MQNNQIKSATTAGLLGIFLGSFGAHNWYLGEKGKGIAHVCMMSGGVLLWVVSAIILPLVLNVAAFLSAAAFLAILTPVAIVAMAASGIWGLIEAIIILSQGDDGLARKGYLVATPTAMTQPQYGPQPMNNGYGYYNGQPMNGGYGQPMNNGYNGQPMDNGYGQPTNNGYNMPENMNNTNNDMGNANGNTPSDSNNDKQN